METGLLKGLPSKIVMLIGVASVVALSGYLSNRYDQSQVTPKNTASAEALKKYDSAQNEPPRAVSPGVLLKKNTELTKLLNRGMQRPRLSWG